MAKMTDYVREGFKRRRRPWDRTELPEWWNLAVWFGLAGIVAMVALAAVFGPDGAPGPNTAKPVPYSVQSLNPYSSSSASGGPAFAAPTAGSDSPSAGVSGTDFAATDPAQVPMTGGGRAVVPAGALNVALAAAKATATGDWTGIPFVGARRPAATGRTPHGFVIGAVTVADPGVTGNSQYVFSATISHGGAAKPHLVKIAVELGQSGYAVRAR
jgi:hypothetical protein